MYRRSRSSSFHWLLRPHILELGRVLLTNPSSLVCACFVHRYIPGVCLAHSRHSINADNSENEKQSVYSHTPVR